MPLIRIYTCLVCEATLRTDFADPVPSHCGQAAKWRQTRDYKPEEHGWSTGQKTAAIGFRHTSPWEIPVQGADGQQLKLESLRDVRKLENESAKQAADGIGQEMRFRAFNNDVKGGTGGGMRRNSFGEAPHRAPQLYDAKGRQRISFEVVDGEPVETMGPGADESLASALPESPQV